MTVVVMGLVWVLWPVFAFAGGLALAPLNGLAGLVLGSAALVRRLVRPRLYMAALAAFLVFCAVSALWSPRPFEFLEFDPGAGDVNLRSEVARLGLGLLASGLVMAWIQNTTPERAGLVFRLAVAALVLQFVIVAGLAAFQQQALDLFAPMMSSEAEGVQNITRNALLLSAGLPILLYGVRKGGVVIAALVLLATIAALFVLGADAGLLAIAASMASVAVVKVWPTSGFRVLAGLIAAAVLTMPGVAWLLGRDATQAGAETSLDWRLLIWNRVIEEIEKSPLRGGGIGVLRTIDETIETGPLAGGMLVPNHSHNMAMQLWAETGAAGAVLLALTVVLAGWRLPAPQSLGPRAYAVAGLIGAAGTIGAVSFDLWNEWWWAAVSLLAVAVLALCRSPAPEQPAERGIRFGEPSA